MKKTTSLACLLTVSYLTCFCQQWSGSNSTSGTITRDGIVVVGGNNVVGSWSSPDGVIEIQSKPGEFSFVALREQGNNLSSFDIGFKANTFGALYTNQVPMLFFTNSQERMRIAPNGHIGIGTANPGSFKLAVEGKIGARELKVTLLSPWPDYVFDKNYKLLSISHLENYITKNKHLPNIPSSRQIQNDKGFEVGALTTKLLEKIEEQTLYIIQLQKQTDDIKKQLEKLKK